jgi:hypothetical protein
LVLASLNSCPDSTATPVMKWITKNDVKEVSRMRHVDTCHDKK